MRYHIKYSHKIELNIAGSSRKSITPKSRNKASLISNPSFYSHTTNSEPKNLQTKFQDEIDKLLECSVCLDQFKKPKMLKCQHSFCLDPCLRNMAKRIGENLIVECALCRKKWVAKDLNNFPIQEQVQYITIYTYIWITQIKIYLNRFI